MAYVSHLLLHGLWAVLLSWEVRPLSVLVPGAYRCVDMTAGTGGKQDF